MKKILILSLLYLFCTQYGVAETKKGQKKTLTLGQLWQQSYVETGRELKAATKETNWDEHIEFMDNMIYIFDTSNDVSEKKMALQTLGKVSHPKVMSFFERVIDTDTGNIYRYNATMYLGWIDAQSSISFLLKRSQDSTLSAYERTCVAATLTVLEDWENAEKILNENCFTTEGAFCNECIWAYYKLGNESSKKYYKYIIENSTSPGFTNQCAQRLADLGDEKTTLPVFEKILKTETEEYIRKGALRGLESLDSRRSLKMIQKYQTDPDPEIQKYVSTILKDREVRLQKKELDSIKLK